MSIPDICISFIVALIGIAYPLMLQVISRLEDKYFSIQVLNLIKSEKVWKSFSISIKVSLVIVFFYVAINYPLITLSDKLLTIILHFIVIALIIGTVLSVFSFVLFTKMVLEYYSTTKLIQYLIKYDRKVFKKEEAYLKAIGDILYQSIRQQNETVTKTISDYLYEVFQRYRDNYKGKEIEYPYSYYELVYKTIEELAILKEKRITFLEYRTVGGLWFFGETKGYSIHESTYNWIWRNLSLAIKYNRDDYIMYYWERAHQYITYNLPYLQTDYDYKTGKIKNEQEIAIRTQERERFFEFHYALGGLLLYSNRYDVIGRIFRYTTSMPPVYELLPNHMNEVFKQYFKFRDPYDNDFMRIRQRYYFPNIEGINSEYIIKNWMCKYLTLLFLRQYSIVPYLIIMKPLEYPTIPAHQNEKKMWLDNIGHFKTLVGDHLANLQLIKSISFEFLIDGKIEKTDNPAPMKFIENLEEMVEKDFIRTELEQPISKDKKEAFISFTSQHLVSTFELLKPISNDKITEVEFKDWFITGGNAIIDKSAFAENQHADNMNYHSFLAESLSDKCYRGISEIFYIQTKKRYLFKPEDFFKAMDNLKLSPDKHIIIAFGINLSSYDVFANISGLSEKDYKGVPIYKYNMCNHHLAGQTIFILQKDNLPSIDFLAAEKSEIEKYSLEKINEDFNLNGQVIDLYRNEGIRIELSQSRPSEDLTKSVLLNISFNIRFRWKKEMNMISFRLYSKYEERGLPNTSNEVESFK